MPTLPSNPNLEQLRHQARDLLRAARAGDPEASERIRSVSEQVTLASAQLALARGYGFDSWPALKAEVEAQTRTLAEAATTFLTESVRGRIGRAGQLLARHPEIADYDIRTAVALGDAARVGAALERDPDLVGRRDPRTGWTALHLACASRWHVDPKRAEGLLAIVGMLLDRGAEPDRPPTDESQWSPLRCAVAGTTSGRGNEQLVRLLLERGAKVADHDLYLAGFAEGGHQWCVRLLVEYTADVRAIAEQAFAAPVSLKDTEGVRVLIEAGADPRRYRNDDGHPTGGVPEAIAAGCDIELIDLLLAHGADPNQVGKDGRSAYAFAMSSGRGDLVQLLGRYGAHDDTTALDRLRYSCLQGDRAGALALLDRNPALRAQLADADSSALISAAESGNAKAIDVLLEVGFPPAAEGPFNPAGVDGVTALHAGAWAGSAEAVTKLLAAGARVDALDSRWQSTPLVWALVGSGERRSSNPAPDWAQTVRVLLDAGATTSQIAGDPDDSIQPGPEVVELLRGRGILP